MANDLTSKLDGGYGWVILFASFLCQFMVGGSLFSFGLFFVEISNEFNTVGKSGISWIVAILISLSGLIGPVASVLVNRYGCRLVSILGSLIAAFGFGISFLVRTVPPLYFTIGICGGIGLGLVYFPAVVIVHEYFSKRRSTAIGVSVCGSGLGTFVFQWAIGKVLIDFSWRSCLAIESGAILSSVFLGMLYKPIQSHKCSEIAENGNESNDSLPEKNEGRKVSMDLSLLKKPLFIAYTLCDIFGSFGYNIPYIYLPEIGKHFEIGGVSTLLGIVGITNVLSRLGTGFLSDKPWVNRLYLYNAALIIIGIGMIVSPHLDSLWSLKAYAGIYGLSVGLLNSLKTVVLVDLVGPEYFTDAFGISLFISSLAALFGPPIVGFLYDLDGHYATGFYFAGSIVAMSGVLMLILVPCIKKFQQMKSKSKFLEKLKKVDLGVHNTMLTSCSTHSISHM